MNRYVNVWEPVLSAFEERYPHVADITTNWYPCGQNEIVVKTKNGDVLIFNFIGSTIRKVDRNIDLDSNDIEEDDWRIEFSNRLNQKMASAGIPRWRLSQLTGISEPTLSKYMNGRSTPSMYNARKISRALRCPIGELGEFNV